MQQQLVGKQVSLRCARSGRNSSLVWAWSARQAFFSDERLQHGCGETGRGLVAPQSSSVCPLLALTGAAVPP
jgi:hypothetical protein